MCVPIPYLILIIYNDTRKNKSIYIFQSKLNWGYFRSHLFMHVPCLHIGLHRFLSFSLSLFIPMSPSIAPMHTLHALYLHQFLSCCFRFSSFIQLWCVWAQHHKSKIQYFFRAECILHVRLTAFSPQPTDERRNNFKFFYI